MRKDDDNSIQLKEELFHVPFESRSRIGNYRFSINGYPSLYLADSIYTCWLELGAPKVSDCKVLKFSFYKSKHSIFHLNRKYDITEKFSQKMKNPTYWDKWVYGMILAKIIIYPLELVCSLPSEENSIFKQEYIIPQMLLEWIRCSDDIDGLQYRSTKKSIVDSKTHYDYVFPAKGVLSQGHCPRLLEQFNYTVPNTICFQSEYEAYSFSEGGVRQ